MLIDGKNIALFERLKMKEEINVLKNKGFRIPKLVVIIVGEDEASLVYVRNKEKACIEVGIDSLILRKEKEFSEEEMLILIDELNNDDNIDGILVQLPLPKQIDETKVIEAINPSKDVDGFHPNNIAKLFLNQETFRPCTPEGIMTLLDEIKIDLSGKEVVIVGRSYNVGKPTGIMCLNKNATVTFVHSKTKELKKVCKRADILIVAVGKAHLINEEYVKDGAVIIDVGINRDLNNRLCGDVDLKRVINKVSAITPVPGGVGPMTIAMLLKNTLKAYKMRNGG
jgi:5,10-methylene-tetrahydrofolate dehydrogenase/Methenyl tetrahydrofolate cyclohydrolase